MTKSILVGVFLLIAFVISIVYVLDSNGGSSAAMKPKVKSIYEINALDIDGNNVNLGKYKDQVILFVNTASKCGYTPQYKGLQAIYDKYKNRGFVILGFPSNNFGGQEPGTNKEIKEFCTLKYKVTFPMFAKIAVKGADKHPLYEYLTSKETNPEFGGEITWNFNKFLANHRGEIIARFSSKETPESKEVTSSIEKAIKEKNKEKDQDS